MSHRLTSSLTALAVVLILLFSCAAGQVTSGYGLLSPGQKNPTAQKGTVDALVNAYFTQTAEAQAQFAITQTIQAAFHQARMATAAFESTVQASFSQAVGATATAEYAATLSVLASMHVTSNVNWHSIIQAFDGVEMVLVPSGCYLMGSDDGARSEQPVHEVCFGRPFWIDRYEVTNGQFARFGGNASVSSQWTGTNLPRERISWAEARSFCDLRGARLPSEAEWEYAARGTDGLTFTWGNEFVPENLAYYETSAYSTSNVGNRLGGVSWVGAQDLLGNVWEWVDDWYWPTYYQHSPLENPPGPAEGQYRVLRGGSWSSYKTTDLRAANRFWLEPENGSNADVGFRCARDFDQQYSEVVEQPTEAVVEAESSCLATGELVVGTDAAWPPFESVDAVTQQIVGFDIELLKAIGQKVGFTPTYLNAPWDGLLGMLTSGEIDLVVSGVSITTDRMQHFLFSNPYYVIPGESAEYLGIAMRKECTELQEAINRGLSLAIVDGTYASLLSFWFGQSPDAAFQAGAGGLALDSQLNPLQLPPPVR